MSLKKWQSEGKLRPHKTSKEEITNLLKIVERDIKDASIPELSPDRRFAIAYNAILQLATIPLYCKGFRSKGQVIITSFSSHCYLRLEMK